MNISMIVAVDNKNGIGKKNQLPWYLPSDLKRFKSLTMGHHIIMGRKTYESIGKALPGRTNIVITQNKKYKPLGCFVVNSIQEAIDLAKKNNDTEAFIIGGGEVFRRSLNIVNKIYLTLVEVDSGADVFFPSLDMSEWKVVALGDQYINDKDEFASDFKVLIRDHSPKY